MHVPLFRPTMRRRYMHAVLTQLVDEDIGPGKITRELAASLSAYVGAAGGVAVSDTYASLALAAEVLGLRSGDRVVVSALAPSVYLDVLRSRGLEVLLVDVEPESGAVSAASVGSLLGSGVKAVFAHDAWGLPFAYGPASEAGVPVLRDATYSLAPAPAAEAELEHETADLLLVSFDGSGAIAAGGGAALLAKKRGLLAGLKNPAGNMSKHQQLSNYASALALALLHDVDNDRARRLEIVAQYAAAVKRSRHAVLAAGGDGGVPAYAFIVRLKDSLAEARAYAKKHGVDTLPAFEGSSVAASDELADACPNARKLLLCSLLFPLYPMLGRKDVEGVCRVLATLP